MAEAQSLITPAGSVGALQYSGGAVLAGAGWKFVGTAGSERLLGPGATDDGTTPLQVNGNARIGNSGGAAFTLTIADGQITKQPGQTMDFGACSFTNGTTLQYFLSLGMKVGNGTTSGYLNTDAPGKVLIIGDTATSQSGGIIDVALPIWTRLSDAATTTVTNALTLGHNSSATPSFNFGTGLLFNAKSSTTNDRNVATIEATWSTATDASRIGQLAFSVYAISTKTTLIKLSGAGSGSIGFFGTNPTSQPSPTGDTTIGSAGGASPAYIDTAYTGALGSSFYTMGDIVTALKNLGLIAL